MTSLSSDLCSTRSRRNSCSSAGGGNPGIGKSLPPVLSLDTSPSSTTLSTPASTPADSLSTLASSVESDSLAVTDEGHGFTTIGFEPSLETKLVQSFHLPNMFAGLCPLDKSRDPALEFDPVYLEGVVIGSDTDANEGNPSSELHNVSNRSFSTQEGNESSDTDVSRNLGQLGHFRARTRLSFPTGASERLIELSQKCHSLYPDFRKLHGPKTSPPSQQELAAALSDWIESFSDRADAGSDVSEDMDESIIRFKMAEGGRCMPLEFGSDVKVYWYASDDLNTWHRTSTIMRATTSIEQVGSLIPIISVKRSDRTRSWGPGVSNDVNFRLGAVLEDEETSVPERDKRACNLVAYMS